MVKRVPTPSPESTQMAPRPPAHTETEIKLRIPDRVSLLGKISRLSPDCSGRVLERNTLFDTPGHDIRRRGRLLRLRVETPAPSPLIPGGLRRAWITSKSPASGLAHSRYKVKFERESPVDPARNWITEFRRLGFHPGFRYEKFRTRFRNIPTARGLHLDLDETPVGNFLEIEGAPRQIDRIARALGFSPRDYIRATYWYLYAADCRRRGRIPRNMRFHA
jgi:adenylate cyclase class 2